MTVGERIKELRKHLGLNQTEFGARIGNPQTTVANWETGRTSCPEAALLSIVREYGCSESWLRSGEGDMFAPVTVGEELSAFCGKLTRGGGTYAQRVFATVLARLPDEAVDDFLRTVLTVADELLEKENATDN